MGDRDKGTTTETTEKAETTVVQPDSERTERSETTEKVEQPADDEDKPF